MELREAFEAADTDKGGALDIKEVSLTYFTSQILLFYNTYVLIYQFKEAFGGVIGRGMTMKQLTQLFMKIDADSNGSVGKQNL